MNDKEYENLKNGTRWEKFSHHELQMLRYGLAQIYDHTTNTVEDLLKELNNILSPRELDKQHSQTEVDK